MNNNCIYLEYCSNSSAVETLFQCTQHILGRYDQFLDQSRHESMPLHLFIREQVMFNYIHTEAHIIIHIIIHMTEMATMQDT